MASKSATKREEQFIVEETKIIKCDVPLSVYRTLTKLAADSVPFLKVNAYCCNILTDHAEKKGKKG